MRHLWLGVALSALAQFSAAAEPLRKPGDCPFLRPMAKCPPMAVERGNEKQAESAG
jgi:hypothetical protein